MKVFEFSIKVKGYGADVDEALSEAFDALEDNAPATVGKDIEYEELPPDERCEKFKRTLEVLASTTPPWNAPVASDS
tara:strand:- start:410 stop:640 length:231 start_codon:yes stop_codon:yes gene_type:complete